MVDHHLYDYRLHLATGLVYVKDNTLNINDTFTYNSSQLFNGIVCYLTPNYGYKYWKARSSEIFKLSNANTAWVA